MEDIETKSPHRLAAEKYVSEFFEDWMKNFAKPLEGLESYVHVVEYALERASQDNINSKKHLH